MKKVVAIIVLLLAVSFCGGKAEALHSTTNNAGALYYTYYNNIEEGTVIRHIQTEVPGYGTNISDQLILKVNSQTKTATVVSCSQEATDVVIPSTILGYVQVTGIEDYAFQGCANLARVVIPNTILDIGDFAFENCVSLQSVSIPNSVDGLGMGTFYGCVSLKSISIAYSNVTMIPKRFAEGCTALTSCNIPDNIRDIGAFAFHNSGMRTITVGNNVTSVGEWALYSYQLTSLEFTANTPPSFPIVYGGLTTQLNFNVKVPSGKQVLYAQALAAGNISCKGIEESTSNSFVANGVTYRILSDATAEVAKFADASAGYLVIPGRVMDGSTGKYYDVTSFGYLAVKDATNVTTISLPATLTNIESYAFAYSNAISIVIPANVATVGEQAFFGCGKLEFLGFQGKVPPTIGSKAYVLGLTTVHIPKGLVNTYKKAFGSNLVYKELVEDESYGTYTEETNSDPIVADPKPQLPMPTKPTLTVTKKSSGTRTLKITKMKGGVNRVIVYRSTKKADGYKKLATKKISSGKTTLNYNDKTAKKGKTYYYKVRTYYTNNSKKVLSPFSAIKKSKK